MGEIVYVDLLFLINFSMDFLCFYLCSVILSRKLSAMRAVGASVVGGIYSDVALFIEMPRIWALVTDIGVCALICLIAFYKKGKARDIPVLTIVYLAVSMALGGFMTAIFNLLNKADIPLGQEGGGDGISVWSFALLAGISAVITLVGGRFFKRKSQQKVSQLSIKNLGRSISVRGLTDSGNLLREPISSKPCIICDISALEKILPESVIKAARERDVSALWQIPHSENLGIRVIPIKTAGGEGMLLAFRADELKINCGHGERDIDAFIALSDIKDGADGCEALVPSELLV